jgi:hypothetical protein
MTSRHMGRETASGQHVYYQPREQINWMLPMCPSRRPISGLARPNQVKTGTAGTGIAVALLLAPSPISVVPWGPWQRATQR